MTEEELNGIPVADIPGTFLYGCRKLRVGDMGLIPAVHDEDDLHSVGTLAVLVNRITEQNLSSDDGKPWLLRGHTPFHASVSNLAVLACALIVGDKAGIPVPHIAKRWESLLGTALQLFQLAETK